MEMRSPCSSLATGSVICSKPRLGQVLVPLLLAVRCIRNRMSSLDEM